MEIDERGFKRVENGKEAFNAVWDILHNIIAHLPQEYYVKVAGEYNGNIDAILEHLNDRE